MLVLNTVDMLSQGVKTSVPLHLWEVSCCLCFITNPKKTKLSHYSHNDADYGFTSKRVGIAVLHSMQNLHINL